MDEKEPTLLNNIIKMVPIAAIFIAMFWLMSSSQRKEKKKKEELAKSLKKGLVWMKPSSHLDCKYVIHTCRRM